MNLKARFVVPVDAPVIEDGAVTIQDGVIRSVGPDAGASGAHATDFGDAVILPGFVNAHTHLELGHLSGRVPPSADFIGWINQLMALRESDPQPEQSAADAVQDGIAQSLAYGVTTVGDITRTPHRSRPILARSAIRGVSFGEVSAIGNRLSLLGERLAVAASREHETNRVRVGVSPHAPYSIAPEAVAACVETAIERHLPLCMHLAETRDEVRFTQSADGPFADALRDLGIWDGSIQPTGLSPIELAADTELLTPNTLIAHANYVSDSDVDLIAQAKSHVAFCPRTHAAFEHAPHRFRDMQAAGINVCIGTDSLASNPSLSILDELRFLQRAQCDVSADTLMAMGTLNGARALGWDKTIGSIAPGKAADLVVIPFETTGDHARWTQVFESDATPIAVYIDGTPQ